MIASYDPQLLWILVAGLLVGGTIAWGICSILYRGRRIQALQETATRFASAQAQTGELRTQLATLQQERDRIHQEFRLMEVAKVSAETNLENTQRHLAEQRALLEDAKMTLSDTFRSLASEALAGNNRGFLTLAEEKFKALKDEATASFDQRQTSIESLLQPLTESLRTYQKESQALEDKRLRELSVVGEQLRQLASAQTTLQAETAKLVNALRSPQVRGRWGEIALRRTAELAGMSENCDFFEQESVSTETGRLRPDMIVKLPAGRDVVVDSKVPLSAFLDSLETHTDEDREAALNRHLGQVKRHISQLASKEYWDQFPAAPEFVVLFIPNDSFLAAAAERDPSLVESALTKKVVIATPTTFIALLRAIAYGWRQEQVAEGAQRISILGQELADRLGTLAEHFGRIGQALGRTVESYNATVTSLENRIWPTARKFKTLGISAKKDLMDLKSVEHMPRPPGEMEPPPEDFPPASS
ncbi:DNA recombination protein RmuC [Candidatus Nitrospira allomarina]|uniref:DNA recombination protein RmuC n=1 Tax=Candidatus Nitrospira allomarina TaxID=3020900 RepID=A0AA96JV48_9BACT|nr:DNA recombination protein RmuC [Candidatus Nitrospira allomarina]WNM56506.1 DNA recombination protein RmuC [Candidatus Nitrospira allomarina]